MAQETQNVQTVCLKKNTGLTQMLRPLEELALVEEVEAVSFEKNCFASLVSIFGTMFFFGWLLCCPSRPLSPCATTLVVHHERSEDREKDAHSASTLD